MVPSCVTSVPKVLLLLVFKPRALVELLEPSKFGLEMLENPLELVNRVDGCSAELGWGTVLISLPGEANSMKI